MLEETPQRELIARAESLLTRLRDIQACRITTDETGQITEIHIVASSDRSPKLIARDVETCLRAELGLYVDYRKIGVVLIDSRKDLSSKREDHGQRWTDKLAAEAESELDKAEIPGERSSVHVEDIADRGRPELEFLEEDMRVRFKGLAITLDGEELSVEVRLERNRVETVGSVSSVKLGEPIHEVIGRATVHALVELLDEDFNLCLSEIDEVDLKGREAFLAMIDMVAGREVKSYVGCVFIGRDRNEAAALAVLDAINRPLGRWRSRKEIHYTIR